MGAWLVLTCPGRAWLVLAILTVTSLLSVKGKLITEHKEEIARCADQGELYSAEARGCFEPLQQQPCDQGEMLVMSSEGLGVCKEDICQNSTKTDVLGLCVGIYEQEGCLLTQGQRLRWTLAGQSECGCEDGWGHISGSEECYQQSTRGPCGRGMIVRQTERACTRIGLLESLRHLSPARMADGLDRLRQLNCGQPGGQVCCGLLSLPVELLTEREGIALEVEDLVKAVPFQHPEYECGPNTTPSGNICPSGSRPWPSQSSSKCYRLEDEDFEDSRDCFMHLKGGRMACMTEDELVELRVAKGRSSRCKRRMRFSRLRDRCVPVFG